MKATEAAITIDLQMWHVERIWTEFRNDAGNREISRIFEGAREAAYRKDKQQAPDPAKIPVTVKLTPKQARIVLAAFRPFAGFPSDGEVYMLLKKAFNEG